MIRNFSFTVLVSGFLFFSCRTTMMIVPDQKDGQKQGLSAFSLFLFDPFKRVPMGGDKTVVYKLKAQYFKFRILCKKTENAAFNEDCGHRQIYDLKQKAPYKGKNTDFFYSVFTGLTDKKKTLDVLTPYYVFGGIEPGFTYQLEEVGFEYTTYLNNSATYSTPIQKLRIYKVLNPDLLNITSVPEGVSYLGNFAVSVLPPKEIVKEEEPDVVFLVKEDKFSTVIPINVLSDLYDVGMNRYDSEAIKNRFTSYFKEDYCGSGIQESYCR
ncbi:hypothetical protein EHQ12_08330 [Leptospira gomenensis]|uniref:Lipoprotein n=1 Tax=Leptospira gomenensis TaxID=2484974 RepID=A0A5F1Z2D9_9LEPT|nr:hypothetical protein [Leptospira gomenensis]TGK35937.1 hypothetical protein EHQ17_04960 [Leptospira gomenensis]TGK40031.1 hypothetical protein EHQ12_08330 [Leptospira gomenensis]TGK51481.1 hypothetical protein EHQ07_02725 [Leptospira gomenensis]TGK68038.1 hypothetical protein EHQ13_01255 [Leptospira gomenensis]